MKYMRNGKIFEGLDNVAKGTGRIEKGSKALHFLVTYQYSEFYLNYLPCHFQPMVKGQLPEYLSVKLLARTMSPPCLRRLCPE